MFDLYWIGLTEIWIPITGVYGDQSLCQTWVFCHGLAVEGDAMHKELDLRNLTNAEWGPNLKKCCFSIVIREKILQTWFAPVWEKFGCIDFWERKHKYASYCGHKREKMSRCDFSV